MSYILEALKKSQAERQLGELPSIHAPQVQLQGGGGASGAPRGPLWLALGGVSVAVAAALLWWQPWQAPVPAPAAALAAVPPPPAAAPPLAQVVAAPVAVAAPAAAPAPLPEAKPAPKREAPPAPAVAAAPAAPAPAVAAPAPAFAAAADEIVPGMRDLPEPIQRQIPPLVLGGYIYSKNPADRLLLIDKVLRHEGEELAPGLVLEKLQPKAAIFSFKGYRYRVPY